MLRTIASNDWLTIFLLIGFGLVCLSKFLFESRFHTYLEVISNSKYVKIYTKEQKFIDLFDALLFSNFTLSATVFIYISYNILIESNSFELTWLLKLALGIASFLLIKTLLERLIGSLFEIDNLIDLYLFQKLSYLNYSGFILFISSLLLLFSILPSKPLIFITIVVVGLINLIGFATLIKSHQNLILNNFFYFILYLCTLEIGPYLISYKIITA